LIEDNELPRTKGPGSQPGLFCCFVEGRRSTRRPFSLLSAEAMMRIAAIIAKLPELSRKP